MIVEGVLTGVVANYLFRTLNNLAPDGLKDSPPRPSMPGRACLPQPTVHSTVRANVSLINFQV